MEIVRLLTHYGMHLLLPGIIAWYFFRKNWKLVWLLFIATMIIDLDHLLASPIYDADRCSIGFHPLHSYVAVGSYILLSLFKTTRYLGIGLLLHILADAVDCLWIQGI